MIIGISGKIGSGKDTVGRIIQALTENNITEGEIIEIVNGNLLVVDNDWEIKKFAGKLKQIASLLTGISVEDLEKEEVKNSYLGEEWITKHHNWTTKEQLEVYAKELNKDIESYILTTKDLEYLGNDGIRDLYRFTTLDKKPTVRQFLQQLGTEAIRNNIHENTWVNALFVDYKKPAEIAIKETGGYTNHPNPVDFPNWIITDVRFPNELKAVKDRKGIRIRINRLNSTPQTIFVNKHYRTHPSETALDNAEFDYVIDNSGTINDLIRQVKTILIDEKIIKHPNDKK